MAGEIPSAAERDAAEAVIGETRHSLTLRIGKRAIALTNLSKIFWPDLKLTKRDLLAYYTSISRELLPHLLDRAMVMKRYPNGIGGGHFFMKRAPSPRPAWVRTCRIEHSSGKIIDFPIVEDLASLLWVVNLGCIDLNPWYARCDDVNRPDYLHFDLDPVRPAGFDKVRETALLTTDALTKLGMKVLIKTSGSKGIHLYVPIVRAPAQKQVWQFAKQIARHMASVYPRLITAEYRIARRPPGTVLVDYNQNAWGRTLASVYSVRPLPNAPVSTPVSRSELDRGIEIDDFTIRNVPSRIRKKGDLWRSLLGSEDRFDLGDIM